MKGHSGPVSKALREAIIECGRPLTHIAKEAEIDSAAVIRFVNGQRSLTLTSADRLAVVLGRRLVQGRPTTGRRAKKRT